MLESSAAVSFLFRTIEHVHGRDIVLRRPRKRPHPHLLAHLPPPPFPKYSLLSPFSSLVSSFVKVI